MPSQGSVRHRRAIKQSIYKQLKWLRNVRQRRLNTRHLTRQVNKHRSPCQDFRSESTPLTDMWAGGHRGLVEVQPEASRLKSRLNESLRCNRDNDAGCVQGQKQQQRMSFNSSLAVNTSKQKEGGGYRLQSLSLIEGQTALEKLKSYFLYISHLQFVNRPL